MTGSTGAASNEFVELVNAGSSGGGRRRLQGRLPLFRRHQRHDARDHPRRDDHPGRRLLPARRQRVPRLAHARPERSRPRSRPPAADVAVRDTTGTILDSVGCGDSTNAFVEGHPATAPPATATPGKQLRPDPGRPRHERQRGRLLGQRDPLPGGLEPLGETVGGALRRRPPITPTGHARPESSTDTAYAGPPLAWRFTNCGNCGDWSHRSPHPRTVTLARAHARGCRAGRTRTRAPSGADETNGKGGSTCRY